MGPLSLFRLTRIPRALCAADCAECFVGACVGGCLWVARPSKPRQILRAGGVAPDALAHAGGGELCRAGDLVGLSVFGGGHAVS
nr:MAG TPA: hypothetical protein [Caudoviricetes sp.]